MRYLEYAWLQFLKYVFCYEKQEHRKHLNVSAEKKNSFPPCFQKACPYIYIYIYMYMLILNLNGKN